MFACLLPCCSHSHVLFRLMTSLTCRHDVLVSAREQNKGQNTSKTQCPIHLNADDHGLTRRRLYFRQRLGLFPFIEKTRCVVEHDDGRRWWIPGTSLTRRLLLLLLYTTGTLPVVRIRRSSFDRLWIVTRWAILGVFSRPAQHTQRPPNNALNTLKSSIVKKGKIESTYMGVGCQLNTVQAVVLCCSGWVEWWRQSLEQKKMSHSYFDCVVVWDDIGELKGLNVYKRCSNRGGQSFGETCQWQQQQQQRRGRGRRISNDQNKLSLSLPYIYTS